MTPAARAHCAHIARTDARLISRRTPAIASIPGSPDLRSGVFESIRAHARYASERTANAVGSCGPPGFKSRSLRSVFYRS